LKREDRRTFGDENNVRQAMPRPLGLPNLRCHERATIKMANALPDVFADQIEHHLPLFFSRRPRFLGV
jgi:hypothetical protein